MERAWFIGTPADVAEQIRPYLDDVDWVAPFDYAPIVSGDEEGGTRRMNGLCGILHELPSRVPA